MDRCIDAEFFKMVSKGPLSDPVHWWDNWHVMKQLFDATLLLHTSQLASFKDAIHRREKFQKVVIFGSQKSKTSCNAKFGGFHLHFLVVPFVYPFYNRMTALKVVESTFWNPAELLFNFHIISRYFEMFCYLKYLLTSF